MRLDPSSDARADDEQEVVLPRRQHRSIPVDVEDPAVIGDEDVGGVNVRVAQHPLQGSDSKAGAELFSPGDHRFDLSRPRNQVRAQPIRRR